MSYDVLLSHGSSAKGNVTEGKPKDKETLSVNETIENACSSKSATNTPRKVSSKFSISLPSYFYPNDQPNDNIETGRMKNNEESFPEIKGKVESKLMSMWHNVKYGWSGKMRSNFSKEQPVWLLGRCYHRKMTPTSSMENSAELSFNLENNLVLNEQTQFDPTINIPELGTDVIDVDVCSESAWEEDGIEGFKKDFISRIWMTYRREFPIMNGSNYTSDCGWGCMLRSGQMMLAQALVCHFLGRSWRFDPESQLHATYEDNIHRKILRWFGDSSSKNCPFSIHTLVNLGIESGKKPGDWYGPNSVSHLLKQAVQLASQEIRDLDNINVYVAQDCTVYLLDIFDQCLVPDPQYTSIAPWQQLPKTSNSSPSHMNWKALVLLIPLRLGNEKLNAVYANSLKYLLSTEYCIGIIGGKPKHSLYFVGYQEDKLIHLDPHYCQEMVDVNQEHFPVNSFHCKSPRKMKLLKMDPCCCIGFYCQTKNDFDKFVESVQPYLFPTKQSPTHSDRTWNNTDSSYPMFVFCRGRKSEQQDHEKKKHVFSPAANKYNYNKSDLTDDEVESEEFVII